jgi:ubiquinone biosynthesis protein
MTGNGWQAAYGAARLGAVLVGWSVTVPPVLALRRVRRRAAGPVLAQALPVLAEWLGPAYVKVGQLAATRQDVLPPTWCRALARLQENGRPLPERFVRRQLAAHGLPADRLRLLGAGSVAGVYLVDREDQQAVAVKVLRPGVRAAMSRDLGLLRRIARLMGRSRRFRHLPVVDMVEHIADAVAGQVDLAREHDNLALLHARLDRDSMAVPAAHQGGSPDVLIMEYLPAFGRSEPIVLADQSRAARSLTEAVFQMLFTVGVVHCDLHPGNIRVAEDGRVCLVDAGFVVATDAVLRRQFCEFFVGLSLGNGPRCARSIVDAAVVVPADLDRAAFDAEVSDIVRRYTGLTAAEFSIAGFVDELFALQRRHRLFVTAAFVVPILTLLVIEGTVRAWDPELDFQALAYPIVLGALVRLPRQRHPTQAPVA